MDINIRQSIKNNFKNCNTYELKESINDSVNDKDEVTLPGMGVFFEILWNNSTENMKNAIVNIIKKNVA